ncbi:hypothetical protein BDZ91DRAFT_765821 [Kalaharituber pfeilii]|nr:hypothetical protein BDZ91DRAFT_765821 [Kalaharituber pfeilii]
MPLVEEAIPVEEAVVGMILLAEEMFLVAEEAVTLPVEEVAGEGEVVVAKEEEEEEEEEEERVVVVAVMHSPPPISQASIDVDGNWVPPSSGVDPADYPPPMPSIYYPIGIAAYQKGGHANTVNAPLRFNAADNQFAGPDMGTVNSNDRIMQRRDGARGSRADEEFRRRVRDFSPGFLVRNKAPEAVPDGPLGAAEAAAAWVEAPDERPIRLLKRALDMRRAAGGVPPADPDVPEGVERDPIYARWLRYITGLDDSGLRAVETPEGLARAQERVGRLLADSVRSYDALLADIHADRAARGAQPLPVVERRPFDAAAGDFSREGKLTFYRAAKEDLEQVDVIARELKALNLMHDIEWKDRISDDDATRANRESQRARIRTQHADAVRRLEERKRTMYGWLYSDKQAWLDQREARRRAVVEAARSIPPPLSSHRTDQYGRVIRGFTARVVSQAGGFHTTDETDIGGQSLNWGYFDEDPLAEVPDSNPVTYRLLEQMLQILTSAGVTLRVCQNGGHNEATDMLAYHPGAGTKYAAEFLERCEMLEQLFQVVEFLARRVREERIKASWDMAEPVGPQRPEGKGRGDDQSDPEGVAGRMGDALSPSSALAASGTPQAVGEATAPGQAAPAGRAAGATAGKKTVHFTPPEGAAPASPQRAASGTAPKSALRQPTACTVPATPPPAKGPQRTRNTPHPAAARRAGTAAVSNPVRATAPASSAPVQPIIPAAALADEPRIRMNIKGILEEYTQGLSDSESEESEESEDVSTPTRTPPPRKTCSSTRVSASDAPEISTMTISPREGAQNKATATAGRSTRSHSAAVTLAARVFPNRSHSASTGATPRTPEPSEPRTRTHQLAQIIPTKRTMQSPPPTAPRRAPPQPVRSSPSFRAYTGASTAVGKGSVAILSPSYRHSPRLTPTPIRTPTSVAHPAPSGPVDNYGWTLDDLGPLEDKTLSDIEREKSQARLAEWVRSIEFWSGGTKKLVPVIIEETDVETGEVRDRVEERIEDVKVEKGDGDEEEYENEDEDEQSVIGSEEEGEEEEMSEDEDYYDSERVTTDKGSEEEDEEEAEDDD